MGHSDPVRDLARMVSRPDEQIRLDEAALVIARTEYPRLDTAAQLARLDQFASRLDCEPGRPALENISSLNDLLFQKESFSGNDEDYDDPRNSYLNDVLERKKGIPITLSLVYTEVARRRALPVVGVGFPGHFLVKYLVAADEILLDPYHRGIILTRKDCEERLKAQFGEDAELKPEHFAASTHKQFLARVLNNLKGAYFRGGNFPKVLLMIELALAIDPGCRQEIHDRGMVYFLLRRYAEARADFKAYLSLASPADPQAREAMQMLHRLRGMMN